MMSDSVFEEIKERSQEFFKHSHHDKSHVERVYNLAVRIAKEENADLDVVKAAVLLHDIARAMEDEGKIADHASEGAKMAKSKGTRYTCGECGMVVSVDEECGCSECDLVCCGTPMILFEKGTKAKPKTRK
jgi:uncharacterized protein